MNPTSGDSQGFTVSEIFLVLTLLVILAAVVLVNLPRLDDRTRAAEAGTSAGTNPGR